MFFTYSGAAGDLFELDTWAFTEGSSEPSLDVSVVAGTRCVAGKALVTVQATNNEAVSVAVAAESDFGSKSFAAVAAGKTRVGGVLDPGGERAGRIGVGHGLGHGRRGVGVGAAGSGVRREVLRLSDECGPGVLRAPGPHCSSMPAPAAAFTARRARTGHTIDWPKAF